MHKFKQGVDPEAHDSQTSAQPARALEQHELLQMPKMFGAHGQDLLACEVHARRFRGGSLGPEQASRVSMSARQVSIETSKAFTTPTIVGKITTDKFYVGAKIPRAVAAEGEVAVMLRTDHERQSICHIWHTMVITPEKCTRGQLEARRAMRRLTFLPSACRIRAHRDWQNG